MHVVIVGNGIAGASAARHVRKASADARITLVSDEGRQPFARTALMYVYMGVLTRAHTHLYADRFWDEARVDRVVDRAVGLDPARRRLALAEGGAVSYDRLLVATGSRPAIPPWPGADLEGVRGLYHWADLDAMERQTAGIERAVVVGGGLIGVELAEMLRARDLGVTFLVREGSYLPRAFSPAESALIEAEIRRHGVDLRMGAEVAEVGGAGGRVVSATTTDGEVFPAQYLGVGTGVRPNVEWLGGALDHDRGVLVDETMQASEEGVYAAGDCAQLRQPPAGVRAIEPIWYTARLQGATAGLGLAGHPRPYDPGVFFNSAKFFDLEYQVYGAAGFPVPEGSTDAEWGDGARSVRVRLDASRRVAGVSALGVRLRQEACTRWITEGWTLDAARADLSAARFDPEFTAAPALATP